jgi:hypothetical protein
VGLDAIASLIVAASDLEVVRLIRGAIRAADIEAGGGGAFGIVPTPRIEPRLRHEPEPEILPRPVIHPTPRFEPRPVYHPTARLELQPAPAAADPERPPRCPSPIQPPWKQLVWQTPIPPRAILKVVQYKTDIPHKGSLLDVFV